MMMERRRLGNDDDEVAGNDGDQPRATQRLVLDSDSTSKFRKRSLYQSSTIFKFELPVSVLVSSVSPLSVCRSLGMVVNFFDLVLWMFLPRPFR